MGKDNQSLKARRNAVIPGGAHTYSRGDDQFPLNAPEILIRGEGAYVWDNKDRKYLDYGMGLRSVNLGYGHPEVAQAVYQEALKGNNLTRPSMTELEAAELLVDLIPSFDMVKFAKHGSTVTTAAIKLARAYNGRSKVAVPRQHPFFSYDDWFIGTTPMKKGIPQEISALTLNFDYNDVASLERLFEQNPGEIAAVMLEPATIQGPCHETCLPEQKYNCRNCPNRAENFLHQVQQLCKREGAVFILDEMITGFRWHLRGAQYFYDIEPDLSTFGKAMANGFAVAALGGKQEIMELGSINEIGRERVFLTSTTHGAEMSALGAFIKTVGILKRDEVVDHIWNYGHKLSSAFNEMAGAKGIAGHLYMEGYPCSPNFVTLDSSKQISLAFRTLFSELMIEEGILMPYVSISFAHCQRELDLTMNALDKVMDSYAQALGGTVDDFLKSPSIKPVFREFN